MKTKLLLFFILSTVIPISGLFAQHRRYMDRDERLEYTGWMGTSLYSGDIDRFSYLPSIQTPGFGMGASMKYYMIRGLGVRAGADFSTLWADDRLSQDHYRLKRNFDFHSEVWDFFIAPEYTFWHSARWRWRDDYAYIYAGLGMFAYNTNLYRKQQLLASNTGIQANFPIGMGFKYSLNYQYSLGLDIRVNRTTTDALDAVSANSYRRSDDGKFIPLDNGHVSTKKNSDWYYFTGITLSYIPRRFKVINF